MYTFDMNVLLANTAPCAAILCLAGYDCKVEGTTGYCEPSCESSISLCDKGETCELVEQECEEEGVPCPHTYRCVAGDNMNYTYCILYGFCCVFRCL